MNLIRIFSFHFLLNQFCEVDQLVQNYLIDPDLNRVHEKSDLLNITDVRRFPLRFVVLPDYIYHEERLFAPEDLLLVRSQHHWELGVAQLVVDYQQVDPHVQNHLVER